MHKNHGFSLAEVLVSLFLVASISLLLLKQQWQTSQLVQKVITRLATVTQLDNNFELKQRGFSLVELLISLLLANLLIGGLVQQYIQVKRQVIISQNNLEQAVDLQLAYDLIRRSIQKAGATPCLTISNLDTFDTRTNKANLQALLVGENSLHINRMSDEFTINKESTSQRKLKIPSNIKKNRSTPLLIADCYHAEVHNIYYEGFNVELNSLHFNYQVPIYVGEWIEESYFIKNSRQGIKSLNYRFRDTNELTPLIKSMSLSSKYNQGYTVVTLLLGLKDNSTHELIARVRMK
ncbi:MAG: prepilin-type N-terminal cleavage/methylation domain-containing protein [Legionellaceae bacterium]|nr:prepilin-type N-terminal cleavage/methylation domain-containing protein [Legionellaceae bacterium]